MHSIEQAEQGSAISDSDHFAFPGPENAQFLVRIDSKESGRIIHAVWGRVARPEIPPAFREWIRNSSHPIEFSFRFWHFGVRLIVSLVFLIFAVAMHANGQILGSFWVVYAIFVLLLLSPKFTARRVKMRFARIVLENKGRVCQNCGFLLHGLPDRHECPECGNEYDVKSLRDSWLRWMKSE
ncbi:MAG: hypothetical protein AMXMBFR20_23940 [Planctomycetia bacterium]|jgi:hypothetical protein|nr:MAG: hypothetical protein B6D36_11915 [Planctomycetes bacterium UTPLA1]